MSYFDDYEDGLFSYWESKLLPNIDYDFWTMRDGTQIHISDMSSQHLNSTIKMLEQSDNPYAEGYIEVMKEELKSRNTVHDAINDFN